MHIPTSSKPVSESIDFVFEFGLFSLSWDNDRTRKNGLSDGRGVTSWCHDFWVNPTAVKTKNPFKSMAYIGVGSSPISHPS